MAHLGYNLAILMIMPLLVSITKLISGVSAIKNGFAYSSLNKYYIITCTCNGYYSIQQLQVFISLWPVLRLDEHFSFVILCYFLIFWIQVSILRCFIKVIDKENIQYNTQTESRKLSYQMIQMYAEDQANNSVRIQDGTFVGRITGA